MCAGFCSSVSLSAGRSVAGYRLFKPARAAKLSRRRCRPDVLGRRLLVPHYARTRAKTRVQSTLYGSSRLITSPEDGSTLDYIMPLVLSDACDNLLASPVGLHALIASDSWTILQALIVALASQQNNCTAHSFRDCTAELSPECKRTAAPYSPTTSVPQRQRLRTASEHSQPWPPAPPPSKRWSTL